MAYTPINWQTGDIITADKLNKMDNGWAVESTQLFSETVTTTDQSGSYIAMLAYDDAIDADAITVTFDGTEYTCQRIDAFGAYYYGGFSTQGAVFTEYPFVLQSNYVNNMIITETADTHTIAVAAPTLQTSADFDKARGWSYDAGGTRELFSETVTTAVDPEYPEEGPTAPLSYTLQGDADAITVTFDGTVYECPRNADETYGAPWSNDSFDYSEFPFNLNGSLITTQTAGEHTISVDTMVAPSANVTNEFTMAVSAATSESGSLPFLVIDTFDGSTVKTWNEINAVFRVGVCVLSGLGLVLQMWEGNNRYYMAVANNATYNSAFDPMIWITPGNSPDQALSQYKYNSQMP